MFHSEDPEGQQFSLGGPWDSILVIHSDNVPYFKPFLDIEEKNAGLARSGFLKDSGNTSDAFCRAGTDKAVFVTYFQGGDKTKIWWVIRFVPTPNDPATFGRAVDITETIGTKEKSELLEVIKKVR